MDRLLDYASLDYARYLWRRYGAIVILVAIGCVLAGAGVFLLLPEEAPAELDLEQLIAERERQRRGAAPSAGSGDGYALRITSTPSSAIVYVDSAIVGVTPLEVPGLRGEHQVSVRRRFARLDTTVTVTRDRLLHVSLDDAEAAAPARLATGAGAGDAVDLPDVQTPSSTPAPPRTAPPVADPEPAVEDEPEGVAEEAPPPARTATLVLSSHPAGAIAQLGDRVLGPTPVVVADLAPGTRTLTLTLEGHETETLEVDLDAGATRQLHRELSASTGTLRILVQPWGTIYIDGVLHARDADALYTAEVPAGVRVVRAAHPVAGTVEREVRVRPGQTHEVVIQFTRPSE